MRQILKIFFKAEGTRPVLVLLCLLIGGTLEAAGIGTLLPAIGTLMSSAANGTSAFETTLRSAMTWAGLDSSFETLLAIAVIFLLLRAILLFGAMVFSGITGARVANALRKRLIKAVFDARWSYYAEQSSGRLASVISNDATRAGESYNVSAIAVANIIQVVAYSAVAMLINWRVALVAISGGLLIAIASRKVIWISRAAGYKQSDRTANLTSDMVDLVQNMKSLKAMHRYDPMIENLSLIVRRLRKTLYVQNLARFGVIYGSDVMMVSILAAAAWFAVRLAGIPVEQLLVIGILFLQLMSYVAKFLRQLQAASLLEASYTRTQDMIAEAEKLKEPAFGHLVPPDRQSLQFTKVAFAHGETPVLRDVTLAIPANQITVLQGPSGAGKTTLVDLLIGLHRPTSGNICIGEQDLQNTDIVAWRRRIGYVSQELALFHDTIRENISLSEASISDADILAALDLAGANGFIAALPQGLDTDVGEFGGKLSGGQRQRIALARALVRKPEVLVLDEVTSALDPETEAAIVENISKLRGRYTIIAITHRPAWTRIADVLYSFSGGHVTKNKISSRKR